mmetsp:Transcript_33637/g.72851  ORF Transcript_33637/g.72851 Transcript_33637/m.72851 type:complete len:753 (-) Transcript_33637:964-3222(-)
MTLQASRSRTRYRLVFVITLLTLAVTQVFAFHSAGNSWGARLKAISIRNLDHQICVNYDIESRSARCRTSYAAPLPSTFRGGTGAKPPPSEEEKKRKEKYAAAAKTRKVKKDALSEEPPASGADGHRTPFGKAYGIYTTYLNRLWSETSISQRQRIARNRATAAIKRVQHLMRGEEYADLTPQGNQEDVVGGDGWAEGRDGMEEGDPEHAYKLERARKSMLQACASMLDAMGDEDEAAAATAQKSIEDKAKDSEGGKIDPGESQYLHALDKEDGAANPDIIGKAKGAADKVDPGESEYLHVLDDNNKESAVAASSRQGAVDPAGESEYLHTLDKETKVAAAAEPEIPIPPMMDPGSKTFTVEFPVDIASPDAGAKQVAKVANDRDAVKKKADGGKPRRSILFGATMGALVAGWVFSGNYIFTGLFTLMTVLGQLEYYRMVINTGVYPARRISVLGACSMFVTALFAPDLHQLCLPLFALVSMAWFLTMRHQTSTIPEISTTFTGMFLLGYIPSFWVRIRTLGGDIEPTRLAKLAAPVLSFLGQKADALPAFLPKTVHLPITNGAIFIFWTWLSLAFSDVGAYFVGRSMGKTKLGDVAPAAGAASPNKTVEGVMGGCAISAALSTLGAWVQRWPYWYVTGPIHGIYLGALGLLGDLTASMIKRDADIKDFGDLIPEHGGVMDRVDSYIFAAPYSWIMCKYVIPLMTDWKKAGFGAASAGLVGLMSVPLVWFFSLRRILHIIEERRKRRKQDGL